MSDDKTRNRFVTTLIPGAFGLLPVFGKLRGDNKAADSILLFHSVISTSSSAVQPSVCRVNYGWLRCQMNHFLEKNRGLRCVGILE